MGMGTGARPGSRPPPGVVLGLGVPSPVRPAPGSALGPRDAGSPTALAPRTPSHRGVAFRKSVRGLPRRPGAGRTSATREAGVRVGR